MHRVAVAEDLVGQLVAVEVHHLRQRLGGAARHEDRAAEGAGLARGGRVEPEVRADVANVGLRRPQHAEAHLVEQQELVEVVVAGVPVRLRREARVGPALAHVVVVGERVGRVDLVVAADLVDRAQQRLAEGALGVVHGVGAHQGPVGPGGSTGRDPVPDLHAAQEVGRDLGEAAAGVDDDVLPGDLAGDVAVAQEADLVGRVVGVAVGQRPAVEDAGQVVGAAEGDQLAADTRAGHGDVAQPHDVGADVANPAQGPAIGVAGVVGEDRRGVARALGGAAVVARRAVLVGHLPPVAGRAVAVADDALVLGLHPAGPIRPVRHPGRPGAAHGGRAEDCPVERIGLGLQGRRVARRPPTGVDRDRAHAQIPAQPRPAGVAAGVVGERQVGLHPGSPARHEQRVVQLRAPLVVRARRVDERQPIGGVGVLQPVERAVAQPLRGELGLTAEHPALGVRGRRSAHRPGEARDEREDGKEHSARHAAARHGTTFPSEGGGDPWSYAMSRPAQTPQSRRTWCTRRRAACPVSFRGEVAVVHLLYLEQVARAGMEDLPDKRVRRRRLPPRERP